MKSLRATIVLLAIAFVVECRLRDPSSFVGIQQQEASLVDKEKFARIVDYYRTTFPRATFESMGSLYSTDGPNGERWHIDVPVAVDEEHQHPFSPTFLAAQSASADGLARKIASDLVLLQEERLFTCSSRVGYGDGNMVDCISYVVRVKRQR